MPAIKGKKTVVEEHEIEISLDDLLKAVRKEFYDRMSLPSERAYIGDDGKWTTYSGYSDSPFNKIREATEEEKMIYEAIETLRMIHKL